MSTRSVAYPVSFFFVTFLAIQARAGLKDSAVAAWLFDEGSGVVAADSVDGHDGQLLGDVAWNASGKFGTAIELFGERGAGNRVEVPDAEELTLDTWTITAWVKLQQPDHGDWAIILVKDPANGWQNYSLDLNPQGQVVSEVTSGGSWSNTVSTTSVYDDEWHFVAASYDGVSLRAYVDGELEAEQDFGPGDVSDAPLAIGDRLDASQPLLGIVDDLGLFRVALDDSDLAILMNQGLKQALSLGGLTGDFNANDQLDVGDIDALSAVIAAQTHERRFDLNGDGLVNLADHRVWIVDLKRTYIGDANLDGEFNSTDFVIVFQAGGYEDSLVSNSTWATGDWNADREFNSADFVAAFQDGGFEAGPRAAAAAVPEPSSVVLLLAAAIIGRKRERRNFVTACSRWRSSSCKWWNKSG